MKKYFLSLMIFIFALGLIACEREDIGDRQVIEFWHMSPVGSPSYSATRQIITAYNNSQDEYFVRGTGFGFWDYWDKLNIAISSRTTPDIGLSTIDDVVARAAGGVLYNISDLMAADISETSIDLDELRDTQLQFATYEDDLYALPFSATTRVLYYNLDMFESVGLTAQDVPTTWSELHAVSKLFDQTQGNNIIRLGFDPTYGNATYHGWLWQTGEDFFDEDLMPTLNTQTHIDVLDWIVNFNSDFTRNQLSSFGEGNQMLGINPFAAERVAMIVEVDGLYQTINDANADFRYGVAPIPVPDDDGIRVNWGSGFSIELYDNGRGNTVRRDGAYDFLKYLMSYDTQQALAEANGWIMSHISAMADYVEGDEILTGILAEVDYAMDKVYVPYAPSWHGNDWQPFYNRALERSITSAEALSQARAYYIQRKENYDATN